MSMTAMLTFTGPPENDLRERQCVLDHSWESGPRGVALSPKVRGFFPPVLRVSLRWTGPNLCCRPAHDAGIGRPAINLSECHGSDNAAAERSAAAADVACH